MQVQIVAADVSTKWQKYAREGPLHFVPVNLQADEVTIDGLKELISAKLSLVGPIDLMESDRGPSIEDKSQLKRTKVIHVRCLNLCRSLMMQQRQKEVVEKRETVSCMNRVDLTQNPRNESHSNNRSSSVVSVKAANPVLSKPAKSVMKSVIKRKLPPIPSMTPSKMLGSGKEMVVKESSTAPLKIWEFKINNQGEGVWGEPTYAGIEVRV